MTERTQMKLTFYGDDFTGSTDALEVLTFAGLNCALFLQVPDEATLRHLGPFDAIGVAGASRAMSPSEMDVELAPVLQAMSKLAVPLVHYKVCSTFDSAATLGSIGHAMTLARSAFADTAIPIVAATPKLARYCAFGNLFARSATDGQVHRIDRHPIMRAHPVTPMHEGDLRVHIGAQCKLPIAGFTLPQLALDREAMDSELRRMMQQMQGGAILFDGMTDAHMTEMGRMLDALSQQQQSHSAVSTLPLFCVGGSGVEYALTQWWQSQHPDHHAPRHMETFQGVPQVLAVSGSASPLSELQIGAALAEGFVDLPVDGSALVSEHGAQTELDRLASAAIQALKNGHSVMMHTARGPKDARIDALLSTLVQKGLSIDQARHAGGRRLSQQLGEVIDAVLRAHPLQRLLLSGGDTSSLITQRLAPDAIRVAARLAPGAPLCQFISSQAHLAKLEVALKGGQMGQADYFVKALRGTANATH